MDVLDNKLSNKIENINLSIKKILFFLDEVVNNLLSLILKISILLLKNYLLSKYKEL